MLVDTGVTIAYRCSSCGAFEFFDTSLFRLSCSRAVSMKCRCGKSAVEIFRENAGMYRISMQCMGCGDDHQFNIRRWDMLHREINAFYCPKTGIQECFVGNDGMVRTRIDDIEKELDDLIDMLGYDSYFKNTRVMLDTLNHIHDVAENGKLGCTCGNGDIELVLLPDLVRLECRKCSGSKTIPASTNDELRQLLGCDSLVLSSGKPQAGMHIK